MKRDIVRLSDWKIFEVVSDSGSIREAAGVLGLNASNVMRSLDKVENELRVKLFDRSPNGLRPTEEGLRLKGQVKELMLPLRLGEIDNRKFSLRLKADKRLSFEQMLAVFNQFLQFYPCSRIDFCGSSEAAADEFVELILVREEKKLFGQRYVFVSPRLFADKNRPVTFSELRGFSYIAVGEDLSNTYLSGLRPALTVGDVDEAVRAAQLGMGFCLAFANQSMKQKLSAGSLLQLGLEIPENNWRIEIKSSDGKIKDFLRNKLYMLLGREA